MSIVAKLIVIPCCLEKTEVIQEVLKKSCQRRSGYLGDIRDFAFRNFPSSLPVLVFKGSFPAGCENLPFPLCLRHFGMNCSKLFVVKLGGRLSSLSTSRTGSGFCPCTCIHQPLGERVLVFTPSAPKLVDQNRYYLMLFFFLFDFILLKISASFPPPVSLPIFNAY